MRYHSRLIFHLPSYFLHVISFVLQCNIIQKKSQIWITMHYDPLYSIFAFVSKSCYQLLLILYFKAISCMLEIIGELKGRNLL